MTTGKTIAFIRTLFCYFPIQNKKLKKNPPDAKRGKACREVLCKSESWSHGLGQTLVPLGNPGCEDGQWTHRVVPPLPTPTSDLSAASLRACLIVTHTPPHKLPSAFSHLWKEAQHRLPKRPCLSPTISVPSLPPSSQCGPLPSDPFHPLDTPNSFVACPSAIPDIPDPSSLL